MLKSTTRHVHIFAADIRNDSFIASDSKLTLDVDPDNEFIWNDPALQKVYSEFDRLVAAYTGLALTEYNLRRIGSDLENFIRGLLQQGEIAYNLDSRVLNFSMGRPQVRRSGQIENRPGQ
ncbi:MAG: NAD(P)H-quinone oxidoreductase subunit M [Aphanocapsa lilacina HA4352-LM1]|jgi:NAD(P)H-quinone oxidoreductase subunit M|nr:NAD(P)H-quinone oxidoreductase subunit M [Aphanocapsa lilacina HA4352-LM1]